MTPSTLDADFTALRDCAALDEPAMTEALRAFLEHRSNLVVERAAKMVAEAHLMSLAEDLRSAFSRLLNKPIKSDPGCLAKIAIVAALREIEHPEYEFFKQHLGYTQFEPYFGGLEDKAGALRAECLLGMVERRVPGFLEEAVSLAFDPVPAARAGAVRGIANSARPEAPLLLRMKALAGDESSEVIGEALGGLVHLGDEHLPFVARFLDHDDPTVVGEAAFALAEARSAQAVEMLFQRWKNSPRGPLTQTLFTALALCRHDEAIEALAEVAATAELDQAKTAMTALQQSTDQRRVREVLRERLQGCLQHERTRFFEEAFGDSPGA